MLVVLLVWIALVVLLLLLNNKNNEKRKKTEKYSTLIAKTRFFVAVSIVALVIVTIVVGVHSGEAEDDSVTVSSSGFNIENYTVVLDVDEDYNVAVTEDINVDFYQSLHGIYKFIPKWLKYTNKDGNTDSRKAKINNLRSASEKYSLDTVNGKSRIKIGDANKLVPLGHHEYVIKYNYDFNGDIYEGYDEFIFHAFGDYWGTSIHNPKLIVKLPKKVDLDEKDIHFFADKYRKEDITDHVHLAIDGNTIEATLDEGYYLSKSLTVDILLPDGYFTDVSGENYGYLSMSICIICMILTIILLVLWFKYGKDLPNVPETVEFYPPKGLDAAGIGYLYKGESGKKLSIATIVSLAAKGYIKIEEDRENKDMIIRKNVNVSLADAIERELKIVRLKKDNNDSEVSDAGKKLLSKFSKVGKEYTYNDKIEENYQEITKLVDLGYISISSDTMNEYTPEAIENIKKDLDLKNNREFEFSPAERIVFDKLFTDGIVVRLSEHKTLYKVFSDVSDEEKKIYDDKVNDLKAQKYTVISALWLFISIILWGISYSLIEDLNPRFDYLYLISYLANLISLVFVLLMKRKTEYGEELEAKINGFRNYLKVAEKEQLELCVEDNPNYFYDILPYAYVLGVSKKWMEKFKNIPMPDCDVSYLVNFDTSFYDDIGTHIYYPSSSGGSSSCGGGCSSCGGGCSSCGGGGGW